MRIEWTIACRYVEVHDGLATMVGAGLDRMTVKQLPSPVRVLFAVRVAVAPEDAAGAHQLTASVLNDAMEPIGNPLTATIETKGQPHKQPGWEGHHTLPIGIAFQAAAEGVYTVIFAIDDKTHDYPLVIQLP